MIYKLSAKKPETGWRRTVPQYALSRPNVDDACWGGRNWMFKSEEQKQWMERMAARGWTAPDWPAEYGGGGLNKAETKILKEEMARINARSPLDSFGIWMIGPALLKFGSEALKQQHLPPIIRGEIRWCQGYSEPGAGSDLAGLQAKGEDMGDHFIANGQKVWTSYGIKRLDVLPAAHRLRSQETDGHQSGAV